MFGSSEQITVSEVERKLALLRGLIERRGLRGLALGGAAEVAWLTGGITNRIEPGNPSSALWLVVTPTSAAAVTTNVELPRVEAEAGLGSLGFELHAAPWYEPDCLARKARDLGGESPELGDELIALRLALLPPERERLETLAGDAAAALEQALLAWKPGETDF